MKFNTFADLAEARLVTGTPVTILEPYQIDGIVRATGEGLTLLSGNVFVPFFGDQEVITARKTSLIDDAFPTNYSAYINRYTKDNSGAWVEAADGRTSAVYYGGQAWWPLVEVPYKAGGYLVTDFSLPTGNPDILELELDGSLVFQFNRFKGLVDGGTGGGSIVSETPPDNPLAGIRWTRCSDMKSFIWYVDDTSAQWVEDNPSVGAPLRADDIALGGGAVFASTEDFATGTSLYGVLSPGAVETMSVNHTNISVLNQSDLTKPDVYKVYKLVDYRSNIGNPNFSVGRDNLEVKEFVSSSYIAARVQNASGSGILFDKGVNFTSTNLPVSLAKNRVGANQDRWILLWGDSHSWGQGAPEYDNFSLNTNWSRHSAYPHTKGYMWQIEQYVRDKMQFAENTYYIGHPQIEGRVSPLDARSDVLNDIECTYPVHIEGGKVEVETGNVDPSHITSNTCEEFFAPVCRTDVDGYSLPEYREKLNKGLFKNTLMTLSNADVDDFIPEGFPYFMELIPDPSYPGSGAGFTQITFGSSSTVVAERNDTTDVFYIVMKNREFPQWFSAGADIFIPGLGECEIVSIIGNGAVRLRYSSGSEIGSAGDPYIYPGMKMYPARVANRANLRLEMVKPARAVYVHVQHHANGGDLRISFTDSISGGAALRPYINPSVVFRQNTNGWAPKLSAGGIAVHVVGPGHTLASASKAFVDSLGVVIDTSEISGGGTEEVIYRIDLGSKQIGNCYLSAQCASGESVKTRGVIFDNNKIVNVAEGAHTVGAWLGEESSNASETRDHVADILNYCPIRPSHVITQIPFVNEYIKQTPIATFKTRLSTFVNRHVSHMSSSNNYNNVGVDFMFFTSLRERENLFEGVGESTIKYSDYVNAAREFCEDNGYAFVDCESELIRLVESGRIDYERLFNNNAHPSDFANRAIFEVIRRDYLDFIC